MEILISQYEQLTAFANLWLAWKKAAKGKRGKEAVAAFEYHLEENLLSLQRALQAQTWQPGAYYSFYILDPKRRLISAAPFRDRVVHHALCNIVEPLFESSFIADSYANRLGKGTHKAIRQAQSFARRYPYVLQCDVRQFFPSVDHRILQGLLAQHIADQRILTLCTRILQSGAGILRDEYEMVFFPGDDLLAAVRPRGLPIGNLTSQFWGNVYLDVLDHFVKDDLKVEAYLRYADDFLLFAPNKRTLWRWRRAIIRQLATLRLKLHESSSTVYPVWTGIPFLGWRIYPEHLRLQRKNGVAFQRRYKRLRRAYARGEIPLEKITQSVQGWVSHVQHGRTWGLRRALLHPSVPAVRIDAK